MGCQLIEIPIDGISATDERYIYRDPPPPELLRSIEQVGVLQPLQVLQEGDGYILIRGSRRWRAALATGCRQVPVIIAPETSTPQGLLCDSLQDNLFGPPLNLRERGRAIACAAKLGLSDQGIIKQILPAMGLKPHGEMLKRYRALMRVPTPLLDYFIIKQFSLKRCLPFVDLAPDDATGLAHLARSLGLGPRQFEDGSLWLMESAQREQVPLATVLEEYHYLLEGKSDTRGRRALEFLRCIKARRFPQVARRTEQFEALAAQVRHGRLKWNPQGDPHPLEITLSAAETVDLVEAGTYLRSEAAQLLFDELFTVV